MLNPIIWVCSFLLGFISNGLTFGGFLEANSHIVVGQSHLLPESQVNGTLCTLSLKV